MPDHSGDDCPELRVETLRELSLSDYICLPLDRFGIDGPNGMHLCFVYPVAGPRISGTAQRFDDPNKILRKVAYQAVVAMAALHNQGICHGDFTPSNILIQPSSLDGLSEKEIMQVLGEPQKVDVLTDSGETPTQSTAPKYLVRPVDFYQADRQYITDQIYLIDLGESFNASTPPEDLGVPEPYRSPELILDQAPGIGSDLWALGCTLFEIRTGRKLFNIFDDSTDDHLYYMVLRLGVLPEPWWTRWEARKECFKDEPNSQGRAIEIDPLELSEGSYDPRSIKEALEGGLSYTDPESGEEIDRPISHEETILLSDLLEKILRYDPTSRLNAIMALKHRWFNM